jgi:phage recombination protein Bet
MTNPANEVAQRPAGALAVRPNQTDWTEDQKAALQALGIDNTVSRGDLQVFLTYAQRTGLDPFARQIYLIKRGGRWGIQAGIDGLRVVASRSGKYQGQTAAQWCGPDGIWHDVWLREDHPAAARAGVYHADFREPLYAVATWGQYAAVTAKNEPAAMWAKMPALMLHKCAEALALRRAFPNDLSGLFIAEEMDQQGRAALPRPTTAVPQLTDLVAAVDAAQSIADLQATWREAAVFGLLDDPVAVDKDTGETTSLRDLLMGRAGELGDGGDVDAQTSTSAE